MSARKRTTKRNQSKAVTQVVEVKVLRTRKQKLERGHWQLGTGEISPRFLPRPFDAATIVDRQRLREWVTQRLQERPNAWKSFQKLVSHGCNRDFLLDALATLALTNTSGGGFRATFRCSKREIDAELRRMLRCAEDIDGLPAHVLGDLRNQAPPDGLRAIEKQLRMAAAKRRQRGRPYYDASLAAIIHHIREKTGGSRNSDVARIVEAMRENAYSEEAHEDWLKKHQTLVENPWRN